MCAQKVTKLCSKKKQNSKKTNKVGRFFAFCFSFGGGGTVGGGGRGGGYEKGVCCTSQITKEFLCQKKFQIFVNFQKKKNFFFCFQKKFKVSRQSFWKCRADSKSMKKIQKI